MRLKRTVITAGLLVSALSLAGCYNDRPGHWGHHRDRHHDHHRDHRHGHHDGNRGWGDHDGGWRR